MARVKRAKQLEFLEAVPLFRGLSKTDLTKVARVTEQVTVPAGTVLAEQGASGEAFYLIITGAATVHRNGRKINEMASGDFFGEMAIVDGGPRSATVKAVEDCTVFMIHRRDFSGLIAVPSIARRLLEGMSERLRLADSRLLS